MVSHGTEKDRGPFYMGREAGQGKFFPKGIFEQETEGNKGRRHLASWTHGTLLFLLKEEAAEVWENQVALSRSRDGGSSGSSSNRDRLLSDRSTPGTGLNILLISSRLVLTIN